jgi:hypothetical protein
MHQLCHYEEGGKMDIQADVKQPQFLITGSFIVPVLDLMKKNYLFQDSSQD